jgi:hypothetical protein
MSDLKLDAIKALTYLQEIGQKPLDGDYAEEDANGVVTIRRANGETVLFMNRVDYDAIRESRE